MATPDSRAAANRIGHCTVQSRSRVSSELPISASTRSRSARKAGLTCAVPVNHSPNATSRGSDEVIKMDEAAGRQGPMPGVAVDQCRPEVFVVVSVPQFPQGDGDVVKPVPESAVVEIDDLDLVAPEQRVVEVQVGVDEAENAAVLAQAS